MINICTIETPVLKIALTGGYGEKEKEIKRFIREFHLNDPKLAYPLEVDDFQKSSNINNLGRRLLTFLVKEAFFVERADNYGDTYNYNKAIEALADKYKDDVEDAIGEIRKIKNKTEEEITKHNTETKHLILERMLPEHEGDYFKIQKGREKYRYEPNIITSHCTKIGKNDWLENKTWKHRVKIRREISVEDVIIHPGYLHITNFAGEDEILVINREAKIDVSNKDVTWF